LESNTLFEALSESFGSNNLITVPYYFSNSVNFSMISNSMIQGLTNSSQLWCEYYLLPIQPTPMTNGIRWECDSEYIIKKLKREGKLSEHIQKLIKSGEVCQVIGHKWEYGCSMGAGCLVFHSEQMRHCSLCLKEERQVSVWK